MRVYFCIDALCELTCVFGCQLCNKQTRNTQFNEFDYEMAHMSGESLKAFAALNKSHL